MSGHILRFNPSTRTYVRQGVDGKFSPKVMSQSPRPQPTIQKYPAPPETAPKVLTQQPPATK